MENTEYTQRDMVAEDSVTMIDQDVGATLVDSDSMAAHSNLKPTQYTDVEQPTMCAGANATATADEEATQFDGTKREEVRNIPAIKRMLTGEVVPITKSSFSLGRKDEEVDYVISHNPAISRKHAEIKIRNGKYYVSDLGAKNKTYVNGKVLPTKGESAISNGDVIKLANEDFLVQI